jgi:AcrR family transcriptional regulator
MSSDKAKMTRAAMLRSARELIVERGIDRLSMDQLALRCEKSKGAVMYHFKTRRALLQALIEEYAEHMTERLRRNEAWAVSNLNEAERNDEEARGRALIAAYVRWFREFDADSSEWAQVGVSLLALASHDPELLEPVRAWYRRLIARAEALPFRVRSKVIFCLMAMEGLFFTRKFSLDGMTADQKEAVFAEMRALLERD